MCYNEFKYVDCFLHGIGLHYPSHKLSVIEIIEPVRKI